MEPTSNIQIYLHDGEGIRAGDAIELHKPWMIALDLGDDITIMTRSPEALRRLAAAATEAANKLELAMTR